MSCKETEGGRMVIFVAACLSPYAVCLLSRVQLAPVLLGFFCYKVAILSIYVTLNEVE